MRQDLGPRKRGGLRPLVFQLLIRVLDSFPGSTRLRKRISFAVTLVFVTVAGFAGQALLREWIRHYTFRDRVARIARLPTLDEREVRAQLDHALTKSELRPWLVGNDCAIRSLRSSRIISCEYVVPVEVLPGVRPSLRFRLKVDEPFLAGPNTTFF
jgi:hypothetical protein